MLPGLLPIPTGNTDDDMSDAGAIAQIDKEAELFILSLREQWNLPRGITQVSSSTTEEELLVHYATPTPRPVPSSSKGKTPAPKTQTPTPTMAEFARIRATMQQLDLEKQAALKEVRKLQSKHVRAESLLQQTAAAIHTASVTADQQTTALSQNTHTALEEIRQIILKGQQSYNQQLAIANANIVWLKDKSERDERHNKRRYDRLE